VFNPPGTLLFDSVEPTAETDYWGNQLLTLTYRFLWLPNYGPSIVNGANQHNGWNAILYPNGVRGPLQWANIVDGAGRGVYQVADFSLLFKPDQPVGQNGNYTYP
jgi:hypothetical protein